MDKLIFATNNKHKLQEVSNMLSGFCGVVGLSELNFFEDIPETADTLRDNAIMKAKFIYNRFGINCFADDTGLEVEALGGAPGVLSARYAGEPTNSEKNIDKLLFNLKNSDNRRACFRTVIALVLDEQQIHLFEGMVNGTIIEERIGFYGFGYDSVFVPDGYNKTFAQMSEADKNLISHRGQAVEKLVNFLKNITNK
ncbi:deoxyribonucleotide triphosphate pyrophosphatase [Porphyromonadaceae bacterium COT-184 OH4590]|nr:deoxyribonucleotide triphosphate pyrophosphatase [Porphyromonadaceae bacterium COT-184 OH4590]MDO4725633.1 non-canonical purine NTP diphosphatase [Porphyromonadaceae bacterium]